MILTNHPPPLKKCYQRTKLLFSNIQVPLLLSSVQKQNHRLCKMHSLSIKLINNSLDNTTQQKLKQDMGKYLVLPTNYWSIIGHLHKTFQAWRLLVTDTDLIIGDNHFLLLVLTIPSHHRLQHTDWGEKSDRVYLGYLPQTPHTAGSSSGVLL